MSDQQRDAEDNVWLASLEYRLQIAARIDCECSTYLVVNRGRLLPQMLAAAKRNDEDVAELVARFVAGVHKRHEEGAQIFVAAAGESHGGGQP